MRHHSSRSHIPAEREYAFERYMGAVNGYVARRLPGMTADDLPPQPYRLWFIKRLPAKRAAIRAIRALAH